MTDMRTHTAMLGDMKMNVSEIPTSEILCGLFQAICLNFK